MTANPRARRPRPSSALARAGRLGLLAAAMLIAQAAVAGDGAGIFREACRRDGGYGDYTVNATMLVKDRDGSAVTRKMGVSILEVPGDGSRTLVLFDSPADVKGTSVLMATHASRDDEQWIFLPSFQRVRQISTANQSAAFMGSEFSYEDINSITLQFTKFSYTYLRDDTLNGVRCSVVERKPSYDHSAYGREVVWLDAQSYFVRRVDYFDRDNAPFKTLTADGYAKYLDHFYRPRTLNMVNLKTGRSTTLDWDRYQFRTGLRAADFDPAGLKK